MKKSLALMTLLVALSAQAATETDEAKKSIRALIEPILQKKVQDPKIVLKDFSVAKCEKYKIDWMNVILMRSELELKYSFAPGCDIEGVVKPKIFQSFPSDLKLKNLADFTRLQSENKITAALEEKPVLNLEVRSAQLTGPKGVVKFEADYKIRINPLKKDMIEENLGGEIRVSEIYGKKVSIKEPIKVE